MFHREVSTRQIVNFIETWTDIDPGVHEKRSSHKRFTFRSNHIGHGASLEIYKLYISVRVYFQKSSFVRRCVQSEPTSPKGRMWSNFHLDGDICQGDNCWNPSLFAKPYHTSNRNQTIHENLMSHEIWCSNHFLIISPVDILNLRIGEIIRMKLV